MSMTLSDLQNAARRHQSEVDQRANELGWKRITVALQDNRCPRRLLRKHCRNEREYGDCWCSSRLNDHGDTWRNSDGNRFVLWEPYGAHGEELANVLAAAHEDGLRVDICPSVWNPPHTIGIRFITDER
jgi:hypothetical protein